MTSLRSIQKWRNLIYGAKLRNNLTPRLEVRKIWHERNAAKCCFRLLCASFKMFCRNLVDSWGVMFSFEPISEEETLHWISYWEIRDEKMGNSKNLKSFFARKPPSVSTMSTMYCRHLGLRPWRPNTDSYAASCKLQAPPDCQALWLVSSKTKTVCGWRFPINDFDESPISQQTRRCGGLPKLISERDRDHEGYWGGRLQCWCIFTWVCTE